MQSVNVDFHIAGGTIACIKNASGLLVPDEMAIRGQLEALGVEADQVKMAYRRDDKAYPLDSINLNMSEHGPQLLDHVRESLRQGHVPIVCGGTDTQIWYSTLLVKQLQQEGFLEPGSGQRVVFVSSMPSVEEAPDHVKRLLQGAIELAKTDDKNLSGGFAVCAEHMDANSLAVHNVCDHFDKISSSLIYAFRSGGPVGYISANEWYPNLIQSTSAPLANFKSPIGKRARIAPPLLAGSDSKAILTYLRAVAQNDSGFDGAIIEWPAGQIFKNDIYPIRDMVKMLRQSGFTVAINENLRFNDATLNIQPPISNRPKGKFALSLKSLKEAGAVVFSGLAKDAYIEMTLNGTQAHTKPELPTFMRQGKQAVLRLRYVPDLAIMRDALRSLAPHTNNLLLSALPNHVIPSSMDDVFLEHHTKGLKLWKNFEYSGARYPDAEGRDFLESRKGIVYAASSQLKIIEDIDLPNGAALEVLGKSKGRQVL